MTGISIFAFIQARMGSRRFPGKVLASFRGRPIIEHVLERVASVSEIDRAVILTSDDPADDPLVDYAERLDCDVFRGPLLNVFRRFQLCAEKFPADWILRLCADSPLYNPDVLREVIRHATRSDCDVVTTRFAPPFPKGQNADLIRSDVMLRVDPSALNDHDREHVTPWFYRNRDRYRIVDADPVEIDLPDQDLTVDTPADLARLERLVTEGETTVNFLTTS